MKYQFLFVIGFIIESSDIHFSPVRHQNTSFCQPFFFGIEDRVKHAFVKQEVSHPFGDDDVNFVHREGDFLHQTVDNSDLVAQTVFLNDGAAVNVNVGFFDSINMLCSAFG